MEFSHLLEIVGDEPVFETGLFLAGDVDPANMRRQLGAGFWISQAEHIEENTQRALDQDLIAPQGLTPAAPLGPRLCTDTKQEGSRFGQRSSVLLAASRVYHR